MRQNIVILLFIYCDSIFVHFFRLRRVVMLLGCGALHVGSLPKALHTPIRLFP